MRGIDWKKELNSEQYQAVTCGGGHVLVLAGAGSGKTHTMTYRMARLIDEGVDPDRIMLVTFTNKAAKEMIARARSLTGLALTDIYAGTFHHLANRIIKDNHELLNLTSNYTIWDEDKQKQEIEVSMAEVAGTKNLGDLDDYPKARVVQEILSYAANTDLTVEQAILAKFPQQRKRQRIIFISDVATVYAQRRARSNALDFDGLLLGWRQLLKRCPNLRKAYAERFEHILVDEFQDTNSIQMEILEMMASVHGNLMVVGDDFQSIYSFRGADYDHILSFPVAHKGTKTFTLVTNYRSTPEIVALANESIKNNEEQFEKDLRSGRDEGNLPRKVEVRNQSDQADFVASEIRKLWKKEIPLDQMAVLYRAHFQAMELQMELTRQNIPFKIVSGLSVFRQAHVLDIIAYLTLVHNPHDEASLLRVLRKLKGVGLSIAGKVVDMMREADDPEQTLCGFEDPRGVGGNGKKSLQNFRSCMTGLFNRRGGGEAVGRMIDIVLASGYQDYLALTYDNYETRLTDLKEFGKFATVYESLGSLLEDVALTKEAEEEKGDAGKVLLSTVHQAKGLEWKAVFVIGLAEGMFPLGRALAEEGDKGLEEERRLFYVAVTRAKDCLYMVTPKTDYKKGDILDCSRFIEELPDHTYMHARHVAENRPGPGMPSGQGIKNIPLDVPFTEKDWAKKLGARWDNAGRFWYVPQGKNPMDFIRWIPISVARKLRKDGSLCAA